MSELLIMMRSVLALPRVRTRMQSRTAVSPVRTSDGRLYALDLARFIAMVFMMQGHVLDALVLRSELVITDFPWNIWHLIRGFTAPTFLMVSGAVHAFATKRDESGAVRSDVLSKRIRWAFTIIGIGYLITFPASRVWDLPYVTPAGWQTFLTSNILQLTGATMLLFAVVVAGTKSTRTMGYRALVTAGAILALTPFMHYVATITWLPLWLRSYFTDASGSLFPIFPFSAYLFVGLFVGSRLAQVPKDQRDQVLLSQSWKYGIVVLAIGLTAQYVLYATGTPMSELEGAMSVPLFIRRVGVVLMVFSGAVWVLQRTWGLRAWYSLFGTKSLWIYVIHLLILFGTPWTSSIGRTAYHSMSLGWAIAAAVLIIGATLACAWTFDWFSKQPWAYQWKNRLATASYCLLLVLLLF